MAERINLELLPRHLQAIRSELHSLKENAMIIDKISGWSSIVSP
jgi:hypothetical protein